MKRICLIGITAVLALFCSCGKKGPILPPLVKIPKAVETAALAQIGTEFHLSWRLPTSYLDGSPIEKLEALEIWIFEMDKPAEPGGEVAGGSPEPAEGEAAAKAEGETGKEAEEKTKEGTETKAGTGEKAETKAEKETEEAGKKAKAVEKTGAKAKREATEEAEGEAKEDKKAAEEEAAKEGIEEQAKEKAEGVTPEADAVPEPVPFVAPGPDRMRAEARLLDEVPPERFDEFRKDPEGAPLEFSHVFPFERSQVGKKWYAFSFKIRDGRGRSSDFSAWVAADPLNVSVPPRGLKGDLGRNRITLTWRAPARNLDRTEPASVSGYNVYRAAGEEEPRRLNPAPVADTTYEDRDMEFGNTYRYFIRAVTGAAAPFGESEDSRHVTVEAEDTFAPSAPKGLIAIAGENFISLNWDRSRERDLDSYRVWRRPAGAGEFAPLTEDGIKETSYTDTGAQKNIRYDYAVTALDQKGNESPRSESVTAVITGEGHADLPI